MNRSEKTIYAQLLALFREGFIARKKIGGETHFRIASEGSQDGGWETILPAASDREKIEKKTRNRQEKKSSRDHISESSIASSDVVRNKQQVTVPANEQPVGLEAVVVPQTASSSIQSLAAPLEALEEETLVTHEDEEDVDFSTFPAHLDAVEGHTSLNDTPITATAEKEALRSKIKEAAGRELEKEAKKALVETQKTPDATAPPPTPIPVAPRPGSADAALVASLVAAGVCRGDALRYVEQDASRAKNALEALLEQVRGSGVRSVGALFRALFARGATSNAPSSRAAQEAQCYAHQQGFVIKKGPAGGPTINPHLGENEGYQALMAKHRARKNKA